MADSSSISYERQIISSNWWVWVIFLIVGIGIVLLIYFGLRLFRRSTEVVRVTVPTVVENRQSNIRFVRTPTEVIVDDDPVLPADETSLEAITNNFTAYQGKAVVVSGVTTRVDSINFFTLRQGDFSIIAMSLPEVTTENGLQNVDNPTAQVVRITGTVKLLTRDINKTEFGFEIRDLNEAFWQDQQIIEVKTLEVIPQTTT